MNINIVELTKLCLEYYSDKKMAHALRVACYATEMADTRNFIELDRAYAIGLAHDLIEDTSCPREDLGIIFDEKAMNSVITLTKGDNEAYSDYIDRIINSRDMEARLIKLADIKDHLSRTETLTDKLKDKYSMILGKLMF